jgi:predicted phosphoribosyltransferase
MGPFSADDNGSRRYRDRRDAGVELAARLSAFRDRVDVVVLALPRGGVPVGYEVARAINAPLDVFVVRKLGVPGYPELAMGAIASGGVVVMNDDVVREFRLTRADVDKVAAAEQLELARREQQYRPDRPALDLRGKTVILVDDGLATGATMRAAVEAVRTQLAERIIVAVPVGAPDTCRELSSVADEVVCARTPSDFSAVGLWYRDFSQTSDEEVRALLA